MIVVFHSKRGDLTMSRFLRADVFGRFSKSRHQKHARRRTSLFEQLEDRRLLTGTVTITGTNNNDTLWLRRVGSPQAHCMNTHSTT